MFDETNNFNYKNAEAICMNCENIDCLTRCQWIDIGLEKAREEINKIIVGEDSFVLSECLTCFACEEYCPHGAHPFEFISKAQEKFDSLGISPKFLESAIAKNKPHEELKSKVNEPEKPVLNKCVYGKSLAKHMQGQLFEKLQSIGGIDHYCNFVYHHYSGASISEKRAPIILGNIIKLGIKEMICFHEECYQFYSSYCPQNNLDVPFKVVHFYEYLYNYLNEHKSKIQKLNFKMAYQRPCSNRFVPETDLWVDKICELIGVERVARKYDRENALCCGGIFAILGKRNIMRKAQNDNVNDMLEHGAEICVYNCPMCKAAMGSKVERKGLKNYLLSDLCRLSLGEKLDY